VPGLEEALLRVVELLEGRGVPYMVIGGFANLQWGEPRTTLDLDITVAADDPELVALAGAAGTVLVEDPSGFLARTRVLPVRLADGTRVDLIAATLPYEIDAIGRARAVEVSGRRVRVCAPEDLVIHKILSERPRDIDDVAGVLRRQGRALDIAFLDSAVEGLSRDLANPAILERYRAAKARAGLDASDLDGE
jgi:hypothetical protein